MTEDRVVTAKFPADLVSRLDVAAERIERTKSWIIRNAVEEWLDVEDRRHALTMKALDDVDVGRTYSHDEVIALLHARRQERGETRN